MNAHVPALVREAFAGSRIVAYSTGCVYPYVDVRTAARQKNPDDAAARRLRQFLRRARADVPVFLAHARHAGPHHPAQLCDRHALRRAARRRVARESRACDRSLHRARERDLAGRRERHGAARAGSIAPRRLAAQRQRPGDDQRRWLAEAFGERLGKEPVFAGEEAPTAGWSTPRRRCGCSAIRACRWRADRLDRGLDRARLPSLGKPTGYGKRDGASDAAIGRLALAELADAEALVARPAGTRSRPTGACFSISAPSMRCATGPRDRDRRDAALRRRCAWISMVLVAASIAGRALRPACSTAALPTSPRHASFRCSTPPRPGARSMRRSAFRDAWGFARLVSHERTRAEQVDPKVEIHAIDDSAWPALRAYDAAAFGTDRSAILARLRGRLPPADLFATRDGRLVGLLLGRDGRTAAHLGPLIAEGDTTAIALLERALNRINGTVYLDLADAKAQVRAWLEAAGFARSGRSPACCSAGARASTTCADLRGDRTGVRVAQSKGPARESALCARDQYSFGGLIGGIFTFLSRNSLV
jgi:hypothetical protein